MQQSNCPRTSFRGFHPFHSFLILLLGFCTLFVPAAFAQRDSGTVSGTVQDQNHAVIPNANVTLENTATGDKRTSVSNETGFFHFAAVPVGTYKVSIAAQGFNSYVATDIIMHAGEDHRLPELLLSIAGAQQNVEVVASGASSI